MHTLTSTEAEDAAAARLRAWDFKVERLEVRPGKKTADYRARHGDEVWVLDVKARQADRKLEAELEAGGMVVAHRYTHDVKQHPNQQLALDRFKKGEQQIAATREGDELGAVWLFASDRLGMRVDPEQLRCALLGHRIIFFEGDLKPVYGVYASEFGDVDVAVVVHVDGRIEAMLNPWTNADRLERVRASHLVASVDVVCDPKQAIDSGAAWLAPEEAEARRLAALHLAEVGSRKTADHFEGRRRRDWQVQHALSYLHGPEQLGDAVARLAELFRALETPSRRSLQGLWCELLLIAHAPRIRQAALAWHADPGALHDFAAGRQRIEVKSCLGPHRVHHFRLDQLLAPAGIRVVVASFVLDQSGRGQSIDQLWDVIVARRELTSELRDRLGHVLTHALGRDWREARRVAFDPQAVLAQLRLFDATSIPAVSPDLPGGVSDVRFKAELTGVRNLSPIALRGEAGLFEATFGP